MAGELRERYRAWVDQVVVAARHACPERMIGMVVFGSVGRDRPHDGSDIDALLVMRVLPVGRSARAALATRIEDQALRVAPDLPELSLVLRTVDEVRAGFPLLLDMVEDGWVVEDTRGLLQDLLDGWKARLARHRAARVQRRVVALGFGGLGASGTVVAVTGRSLAESYLKKADVRVMVLRIFVDAQDYSDVVREAQEAVELALKAVLRRIGVEPPKVHDVGALLGVYADRFGGVDVERLAAISRALRKEREMAFCGDVDFLPTEQYSREEAEQALADATEVVTAVRSWMRAQRGDDPEVVLPGG